MNQPSFWKEIKHFQFDFSWSNLRDYILIFLGALLQAFAMRLFLVPAHLVSGGISGIAQLLDYFISVPLGAIIFIGNIPLFFLGWRYLGTMRFALRTVSAVIAFALFTDLIGVFLPQAGFTNDLILQSLYGGVLYGVGCGFVYKGKGTSGGSDILCRILNSYTGIPITQSYLLVDSFVVLAGGFIFGWDIALYGVVVIYISGVAAETIAEGSNIYRTAMIITQHPQKVADQIMTQLNRGVTILDGKGAYTREDRPTLFCALTRSEIPKIKAIVQQTDPNAFIVIGQANEAIGEGFQPLHQPTNTGSQ